MPKTITLKKALDQGHYKAAAVIIIKGVLTALESSAHGSPPGK